MQQQHLAAGICTLHMLLVLLVEQTAVLALHSCI
jgi:hypothetical protein